MPALAKKGLMNQDFEQLFGPAIGQGSQATVYARGDFAVKLYREGYPKRNVFCEAYIMANLEQVDFPSPRVYEVLQAEGRYGLRMDRVKGTLMSEYLDVTDPEKFKTAMDSLVDLQCRLQKADHVAMWAVDLKVRLRNDLENNKMLPSDLRKALTGRLEELPEGKALCHCDFHAGNVFFDGEAYTIIDLLQICVGDPAADAVCSYVSYCFTDLDLGEYYLNRYCEVSGISRERVLQWLPVYAGTLLGEVPERFTPLIERFIAAEGITK